MTIHRRLANLLYGESGPAEIVRTATENETTFRLPQQSSPWTARLSVLVVLVAIGAFGIFLVINGIGRYVGNQRQPIYLFAGVTLVVLAFVSAFNLTRIQWHYEMTVLPHYLSVHYVAFGNRYCTAAIDMTLVRQLTIVRKGEKSLLQAEGTDDTVCLILRQQDHDKLLRLANLLVSEYAKLLPDKELLLIVVEDPAQVAEDRSNAPLGCKIQLTRHENGVTFDFPLGPDPRDVARRQAWRNFEFGILTLVGTVILYGLFAVMELEGIQMLMLAPFVAGLVWLTRASGQSWKAWLDHSTDNEMRQLSVADNMLIRTSRDHRKQIWYRDEVRAIEVVERIATGPGEGGNPNSIDRYFQLTVLLRDGKEVVLQSIIADIACADYRPKAELEWMATELRHTLFGGPGKQTPEHSEAIQELPPRTTDERITS